MLPTIAICHTVAHGAIAAAASSYGASTASSAVGEERHYRASSSVSVSAATSS